MGFTRRHPPKFASDLNQYHQWRSDVVRWCQIISKDDLCTAALLIMGGYVEGRAKVRLTSIPIAELKDVPTNLLATKADCKAEGLEDQVPKGVLRIFKALNPIFLSTGHAARARLSRAATDARRSPATSISSFLDSLELLYSQLSQAGEEFPVALRIQQAIVGLNLTRQDEAIVRGQLLSKNDATWDDLLTIMMGLFPTDHADVKVGDADHMAMIVARDSEEINIQDAHIQCDRCCGYGHTGSVCPSEFEAELEQDPSAGFAAVSP